MDTKGVFNTTSWKQIIEFQLQAIKYKFHLIVVISGSQIEVLGGTLCATSRFFLVSWSPLPSFLAWMTKSVVLVCFCYVGFNVPMSHGCSWLLSFVHWGRGSRVLTSYNTQAFLHFASIEMRLPYMNQTMHFQLHVYLKDKVYKTLSQCSRRMDEQASEMNWGNISWMAHSCIFTRQA